MALSYTSLLCQATIINYEFQLYNFFNNIQQQTDYGFSYTNLLYYLTMINYKFMCTSSIYHTRIISYNSIYISLHHQSSITCNSLSNKNVLYQSTMISNDMFHTIQL